MDSPQQRWNVCVICFSASAKTLHATQVCPALECLQSTFSLKIRLVLISAGAIANHDVMLQ